MQLKYILPKLRENRKTGELLGKSAAFPLTLISVIVHLVPLVPLCAQAQSSVYSRVDIYADEWITVVSPSTLGVAEVSEEVRVKAGYAVDILSGATFVLTTDTIASATRFREQRHEGSLSVTVTPAPDWSWTLGFLTSVEPDYVTHALTLDGSVELSDRMSTLSFRYNASFEKMGSVNDAYFGQSAQGHTLQIQWAQILGRATTLSAVVTGIVHSCGAQVGCQASPYRYVAMLTGGRGSGAPWLALPERHPSLRARGAASIQFAHAFTSELALHAGYRYYRDSWRIDGHTADLSLAVGLWGERLVIRPEGRLAWQSAASFFLDNYTLEQGSDRGPALRSADRELSRLRALQAGLSLEGNFSAVGPFLELGVNARVSRAWYRYFDHTDLPERNAWVAGGGLYATF